MVEACASIAVLAGFGAGGVALLRAAFPDLDDVEAIVYGVPLGAVLASVVLLALACVAPFGATLVLAVTVAIVLVSLPRLRALRVPIATPRTAGAWLLVLVLASLVVRWLAFWHGALTVDGSGLWASQRSLWADGAQHLGDITSFAYGGNFPPHHPRFPGHPFNYHFLTSITTAALVALGMSPWGALCLHSFVFSAFVAAAVPVFARRLGLTRGAAAIALVLLVLGGGLGWWTALHDLAARGWNRPIWDYAAQEAGKLRWLNVYFALIAPQRGLLYGIPLGLLTLRLLWAGCERGAIRAFVAAGIAAGLLPYAHLGTLLALALLTPCLALAFPARRWLVFFAVWSLLAAPQILVQQAGSAGAAGAIRWAPGWVAPPMSWIAFWLLNLGVFFFLVLATFANPGDLPPRARRFLLAFQPLFVVSNLFVFQPWDWDNTKVLIWWYLASCLLVAALLTWMWRQVGPALVVRPAIALALASMTLSGLLENLDQALGRQRSLLLTGEELELARRVREETDAHALFAVGLQHNHPVPVLSGRQVLMSYPAWLWSQGIDAKAREADLRSIMTLGAGATDLLARYGVDYVVVGPDEERRLGADPEAWTARFPEAIGTEHYEVFDVRSAKLPPR